MFAFSVFEHKYLSWVNLVQKLKIVCSKWNLIERLIHKIQWCLFYMNSTQKNLNCWPFQKCELHFFVFQKVPIWQGLLAYQLWAFECNLRCLRWFTSQFPERLRSAFPLKFRLLKIRLLFAWLKCLLIAAMLNLQAWSFASKSSWERQSNALHRSVNNAPNDSHLSTADFHASSIANKQYCVL